MACVYRTASLASLALLCIAAAGAVLAGEAVGPASPLQAVAELEELDEIVVRGKRLAQAIVDAEDDFYRLYNRVNKDDDYDVGCPDLALDRDSRLTTRVCIPGFVANAMADWSQWRARCQPEFRHFDSNRDGRITQMEAVTHPDLVFRLQELDQNGDSMLDEREFKPWADRTAISSNCHQPPPPDLVLMDRTDKWYRHMMQVVRSDPRLQDKASNLDDLYRELNAVKRRGLEVEAAQRPEPAGRRATGPRVR